MSYREHAACARAGSHDRDVALPYAISNLDARLAVHADYQRDFLDLALARNALRFGEFTLKSGRISPYFFNAGLFDSGAALALLGRCYARRRGASGIEFDMLFGPAYKGIALASDHRRRARRQHGRDLPFAFNRKEAKDHGEGGA